MKKNSDVLLLTAKRKSCKFSLFPGWLAAGPFWVKIPGYEETRDCYPVKRANFIESLGIKDVSGAGLCQLDKYGVNVRFQGIAGLPYADANSTAVVLGLLEHLGLSGRARICAGQNVIAWKVDDEVVAILASRSSLGGSIEFEDEATGEWKAPKGHLPPSVRSYYLNGFGDVPKEPKTTYRWSDFKPANNLDRPAVYDCGTNDWFAPGYFIAKAPVNAVYRAKSKHSDMILPTLAVSLETLVEPKFFATRRPDRLIAEVSDGQRMSFDVGYVRAVDSLVGGDKETKIMVCLLDGIQKMMVWLRGDEVVAVLAALGDALTRKVSDGEMPVVGPRNTPKMPSTIAAFIAW